MSDSRAPDGTFGVGNQAAARSRVWREAINRALDKRTRNVGRMEAMEKLANKLLDNCEAGDNVALKELGDRIEGKAIQQTEVSGPGGMPVQIEASERPKLTKEEWLKLHGVGNGGD